jgi:hypothetical protein
MGLCLIDANNLLNRVVIFVLIQLKPVLYANENEKERFDDVFIIVIAKPSLDNSQVTEYEHDLRTSGNTEPLFGLYFKAIHGRKMT